MKIENIILYGLLALAVVGVAFAVSGFSGSELKADKTPNSENNMQMESITTGSMGMGDAAIELTPTEYNDGKLSVRFSANTHSVALSSYDLMKSTFLEYNGKKIYPSSAPPMQGHHNNGMIIFDVEDEPEKFTIKILGIPNVEERIFEWGVK